MIEKTFVERIVFKKSLRFCNSRLFPLLNKTVGKLTIVDISLVAIQDMLSNAVHIMIFALSIFSLVNSSLLLHSLLEASECVLFFKHLHQIEFDLRSWTLIRNIHLLNRSIVTV